MTSEASRPWYRHAWPWLLAIAPTAALVSGLFTFWLASTTSDPLVVDDYYREGRAINQQLARDQVATSLGLQATLRFVPTGDAVAPATLAPATVELRLAAQRGSGWPQQLTLRVVHSTRSERDLQYRLEHAGDGTYRSEGVLPGAGRWLVQIEDPARTWRLVAQGVTQFDSPLDLRADAS